MTKVQLLVSATMPDPRAQREPTALYRLHGADGTLLYIGVSDNPERRFKQHRDSKPWWPQVARKTIEWHPSRRIALAEEAAAIKAEAPAYNIEHNPAMASYCWPPAGMSADRVDAIERQVSALPACLAEGIRRAAWEGFTTDQRVAAASLDRLIAALPDAVDQSMRTAIPHLYTPEKAAEFTAAMTAELRARYAATEAFKALTAEHHIQVEEWDTATLDEKLRDKYLAHYTEHEDGTRLLVVPLGQDPVVRLAAVRALLNHQRSAA